MLRNRQTKNTGDPNNESRIGSDIILEFGFRALGIPLLDVRSQKMQFTIHNLNRDLMTLV